MTLCCMTMGAGGVAISAFVSTWSIPGMRHIIFLSVPRWLRCNTSNLETTPPVGVVPGDFSNPLQIGHVAYHFSQPTEQITMQYFKFGNHTPSGCSSQRLLQSLADSSCSISFFSADRGDYDAILRIWKPHPLWVLFGVIFRSFAYKACSISFFSANCMDSDLILTIS